jgi:monovalent cation:H+ antiporter-2, CPA2 family
LEFHFLKDLLVVFALGGVVVYALRAIKLPAIVGLLLAGAAMGPHGLSLISDVHRVEVLAEIGVVLLLFTVGLEFSLSQLLRMWKTLLGGGGGQVVLCIAAVATATLWRGEGWGKPLFFGFLAALSSTAIVLRLLGERGQLGSPAGRIALGVLLFQDLCIVPLMLLTPYLAGRGSGPSDLALTLLKAAAVVAGVLLAARWLVPPILLRVVQTRSRELFLTLLLVLCLGTAWLTSLAGLSLALGAFLAGLAISESEYSHQAMAEAIPFRDAFGSLFFVSIGMLMDVMFVAKNLPIVAAVVIAVIALKMLTATLPALALGNALHVSLNAGLALAQVGEFAFVLSRVGRELELIDAVEYQVFLSASVLTMVLTPALLYAGRKISERAPDKRFGSEATREGAEEAEHGHTAFANHVVIAGYGVNGQNLARALGRANISYLVLEMNPETVRSARARGEPLHYGDCTRTAVLEMLGIERAKMYVVAISDAASTRQSVSLARSLNPHVYILVRTRFVSEIEELRKLGADQVIPEEFETSIEIFAQVLHRFDVPRNIVLDLVGEVRGGMYGMLRSPDAGRRGAAIEVDALEGAEIERLKIKPDSPAAGRTLAELALRPRTGASVLAIRRAGTVSTNPEAGFRIEAGDVLVVLGERRAIDAALELIAPTPGARAAPSVT